MSEEGKTFSEKASEGLGNIGQSISNATENASNAFSQAKESIGNTLNEYSSKNIINASTGFLDANGLIAKFLFLILVLCGFVFAFYLGMQFIGFFTSAGGSVYVISGMIPEMNSYGTVIHTDNTQPTTLTNIPILRSNNQTTGLEFTWCSWLNLKPNTKGSDDFQLLYVKGSGSNQISRKGISTTNCPGVYLYNRGSNLIQDGNTNVISIMIDTATNPVNINDNNISSYSQVIDISNIPINKWFHLAIRCQNKNIDVYVNGTIYYRSVLNQPPRQNSDSIHVCDTNAAAGSLSDLRYFNYALSVVDINNIVMSGPNTNLYAGYLKSSANKGGNFSNASYLANSWYNKY
jgi:hypothetical protein